MRKVTSSCWAVADADDRTGVDTDDAVDVEAHDAITNISDVVNSNTDLDMAPPAPAAIATSRRASYGPAMSLLTSLKDRAVIASLKMLPQNHMSRAMGALASSTIPKALGTLPVRAFGGVFGVDFDEVKDPLESFGSIKQFFTRALKDG